VVNSCTLSSVSVLGAKLRKSAFENLEIRSDRVRIPIEREGDGQIQIVVNTKVILDRLMKSLQAISMYQSQNSLQPSIQ